MRKTLRLMVASGILMFLLSFMPTLVVQAEELTNDYEKLFEVVTDNVTMYASPTEDAEIIGDLQAGDRLRTFEEQDGWVKTFYAGQPVWVYAKDLHVLEEKERNTTQEETETEDKNDKSNVDDNNKEEIEKNETKDSEVEEKSNERDNHEDYFFEDFQPEHAISGKIELPTGYIEPKTVQVSEDTIKVTKYQLDGYNILIDAGHGGKDSGAVSDGVLEKDITLATAKAIKQYLEQEGANVHFTRDNDTFKSLQERVNRSNSNDTDVFISLHYDYFGDRSVNGINTYFYNQQTSGELADKIHTALTKHLDMNDRGVRKQSYYVLQNNHKPAILLELGFMTNPGDLAKMKTEAYRKDVAKAIADGLVNYFEEK